MMYRYSYSHVSRKFIIHHPSTPPISPSSPTRLRRSVLHPQQALLHRLGSTTYAAHGHEGIRIQEVGGQMLDARTSTGRWKGPKNS